MLTVWPLSGLSGLCLMMFSANTRHNWVPGHPVHYTGLSTESTRGLYSPQASHCCLPFSKLSVSSGRDFLGIIFSIMCKYMFLFVCGLVPGLPQWAERSGCPGIVCRKINDIFSRRCDLVRSRLKVMHRIYLLFSPTTILNRPQCLTGFCGAGPAISPSLSTISDSAQISRH